MHADLGLGKLIESPQQRDAIHIAVAPVVAVGKLWPGQDIGFVEPGNTEKVAMATSPVGIVDPFLKAPLFDGQRFWMFLYPQTVTGMRHEWQHPAFEAVAAQAPLVEVDAKTASLKWMEEFAAEHYASCPDYDETDNHDGRRYTAAELIDAASEYLRTGYRHVQQGSESLRDETPTSEFWKHFQIITGKTVGSEQWDNPFCCTC